MLGWLQKTVPGPKKFVLAKAVKGMQSGMGGHLRPLNRVAVQSSACNFSATKLQGLRGTSAADPGSGLTVDGALCVEIDPWTISRWIDLKHQLG